MGLLKSVVISVCIADFLRVQAFNRSIDLCSNATGNISWSTFATQRNEYTWEVRADRCVSERSALVMRLSTMTTHFQCAKKCIASLSISEGLNDSKATVWELKRKACIIFTSARSNVFTFIRGCNEASWFVSQLYLPITVKMKILKKRVTEVAFSLAYLYHKEEETPKIDAAAGQQQTASITVLAVFFVLTVIALLAVLARQHKEKILDACHDIEDKFKKRKPGDLASKTQVPTSRGTNENRFNGEVGDNVYEGVGDNSVYHEVAARNDREVVQNELYNM